MRGECLGSAADGDFGLCFARVECIGAGATIDRAVGFNADGFAEAELVITGSEVNLQSADVNRIEADFVSAGATSDAEVADSRDVLQGSGFGVGETCVSVGSQVTGDDDVIAGCSGDAEIATGFDIEQRKAVISGSEINGEVASGANTLILGDFGVVFEALEVFDVVEAVEIDVVIVAGDDRVVASTCAHCDIARGNDAAGFGDKDISGVVAGSEVNIDVLVHFQVGIDDLQCERVFAGAEADGNIAGDRGIGADFDIEIIGAAAEADGETAHGGGEWDFENGLSSLSGQAEFGGLEPVYQQGAALNLYADLVWFVVPDEGDVPGAGDGYGHGAAIDCRGSIGHDDDLGIGVFVNDVGGQQLAGFQCLDLQLAGAGELTVAGTFVE